MPLEFCVPHSWELKLQWLDGWQYLTVGLRLTLSAIVRGLKRKCEHWSLWEMKRVVQHLAYKICPVKIMFLSLPGEPRQSSFGWPHNHGEAKNLRRASWFGDDKATGWVESATMNLSRIYNREYFQIFTRNMGTQSTLSLNWPKIGAEFLGSKRCIGTSKH